MSEMVSDRGSMEQLLHENRFTANDDDVSFLY